MVKRVVIAGLLLFAFVASGGGCQGPDEYFRGSPLGATGGIPSTGGNPPATGGTGTGGLGTGGATGGIIGTGGHSTGGVTGTGGVVATGGVPGTGGHSTGGVIGTGGLPGTGGVIATGGIGGRGTGGAGTGGIPGTGGLGGMIGQGGGGGGAAGAANCVDSIRQMGYAFSPAAPCSMCKDNTTDLSTKCASMIDCMEKAYPCTGNCETNCLNMVGGSGVLSTCVNALVTAACP